MIDLLKSFIISEISNYNLRTLEKKHPFRSDPNMEDYGRNYNYSHEDALRKRGITLGKKLVALGKGSSREAYLVGSKKVLKRALNLKGLAQNHAEVDVYTNPKTKPLVAKIYDFAPDYSWVVSELVEELNKKKWEKYVGFPFYFFVEAMYAHPMSSVAEIAAATQADYGSTDKEVQDFFKKSDWVESVLELKRTAHLEIGDLARPEHWGRTLDGRVVLLDYGFTKDVAEEYY
jgi:hypothetical protein